MGKIDDKFTGLALDEDNQSNLTDEQSKAYTNSV